MNTVLSWTCLIVLNYLICALGSPLPTRCRICQRRGQCKPPDCVCCDDTMQFPRKKTPQMVYFTFDDAVAGQIIPYYKTLFPPTRYNPNGCPIAMTLFVSDNDTIYSQVKDFYDRGMEIGVHSVTHHHLTPETFAQEAQGQKEKIIAAGVPSKDIQGWRSPYLEVEGDVQFRNLSNLGFLYDATLSTAQTDQYGTTFPTPFTLDYGWPFNCRINDCPSEEHKGLWEVPVVELRMLEDRPCVYVDACPIPWGNLTTASDLLWHNFNRYYRGSRSPLGFNMHAGWFYDPTRLKAMDQFIEELSQMDDVYILTVSQVIKWFQNPTPLDRLKYFEPWSCPRSKTLHPPIAKPPHFRSNNKKKKSKKMRGKPIPWFKQVHMIETQQQVEQKQTELQPKEIISPSNSMMWMKRFENNQDPAGKFRSASTRQQEAIPPEKVNPPHMSSHEPLGASAVGSPHGGLGRLMWSKRSTRQTAPPTPRPPARQDNHASVLWSIGSAPTRPDTPPRPKQPEAGFARFLLESDMIPNPFVPVPVTTPPPKTKPNFLTPEQILTRLNPSAKYGEEAPVIFPGGTPSFTPVLEGRNKENHASTQKLPEQVEQNKKGVNLGSVKESTKDKLTRIKEQLEALHASVDTHTKSKKSVKVKKNSPKISTPREKNRTRQKSRKLETWENLGASNTNFGFDRSQSNPTSQPDRKLEPWERQGTVNSNFGFDRSQSIPSSTQDRRQDNPDRNAMNHHHIQEPRGPIAKKPNVDSIRFKIMSGNRDTQRSHVPAPRTPVQVQTPIEPSFSSFQNTNPPPKKDVPKMIFNFKPAPSHTHDPVPPQSASRIAAPTKPLIRNIEAEARQHEKMLEWLNNRHQNTPTEPPPVTPKPIMTEKQRIMDFLNKMQLSVPTTQPPEPKDLPPTVGQSWSDIPKPRPHFVPKIHFPDYNPTDLPMTTTEAPPIPKDSFGNRFMKISKFILGDPNRSGSSQPDPAEPGPAPNAAGSDPSASSNANDLASKLSSFLFSKQNDLTNIGSDSNQPNAETSSVRSSDVNHVTVSDLIPQTTFSFPSFQPFSPSPGMYTTAVPVNSLGTCIQNVNCFLPNCLCKSTTHPGTLHMAFIPQIVYIVMDGTVNYHMEKQIKSIFHPNRKNPNNCPISGTLFLSHKYSNYTIVETVDRLGVEIALAGMEPNNNVYVDLLDQDIDDQLQNLRQHGMQSSSVSGWSSPGLHPQGDAQFRKLNKRGFYDSTLLVESTDDKLFWPFTLDYGWDERCLIETCPDDAHDGMWEVPIIPLKMKKINATCKYADSCTFQQMTANETKDYLWSNFQRYYDGNKAPFGIRIHQLWFHNHFSDSLKGLTDFLDEILNINDVYITSIDKMLQWVQRPTAIDDMPYFPQWQC